MQRANCQYARIAVDCKAGSPSLANASTNGTGRTCCRDCSSTARISSTMVAAICSAEELEGVAGLFAGAAPEAFTDAPVALGAVGGGTAGLADAVGFGAANWAGCTPLS